MNYLALQPAPAALEPLDIRISASHSLLVCIAPCEDASDWLFEYLASWQEKEGHIFGTVGKNPRQPIVIWTLACQRSSFFRERVWTAPEIELLLCEVWEEIGAEWISVEPRPSVPPIPAPMPRVELRNEEWSSLRSLNWMAAAMEMDPDRLYRRLERASHGYVYASSEPYLGDGNWQRAADKGEVRGVLTPIHPRTIYLFDKASALTNIDLARSERAKKRERRKV